jgi:DNA-directed RNA polymerase sigma subunit (sigma70/sigma32)
MDSRTREEKTEEINAALAVLHVVRDREGFEGPIPYRTIAEICGCSKQLVWEIEHDALKKLRHPARASVLDDLRTHLH